MRKRHRHGCHRFFMLKKKRTLVILFLSLVGLAVSVYSLLHNQGFASGEFCTIGETLNCDIVNKGPFSQIAGVPVSFIGVLGYLFLSMAAAMKMAHPQDKGLTKFLLLSSVAGFLFSLYLTGLEAFVLHAWCLLCLTSQFLILVILFLCSFLSTELRAK